MSPGGAMVRRLLLTALVAVLAVALPASAEEDPAASEPGPEPAAECLPLDPYCAATAALDGCEAWQMDCNLATACDGLEVCAADDGAESFDSTCSAVDLNLPSANQPVTELLVLDPDGCLRSFIRRTLGLPPADYEPVAVYASSLIFRS